MVVKNRKDPTPRPAGAIWAKFGKKILLVLSAALDAVPSLSRHTSLRDTWAAEPPATPRRGLKPPARFTKPRWAVAEFIEAGLGDLRAGHAPFSLRERGWG